MSNQSVIAAELEAIWESRARLTPEDVLDVATPKGSPLHRFFEWADSEAARKYRLDQARGLIRSVKIRVTQGDEDFSVRQYQAVRHAGVETAPEGYLPDSELDEEMREALLRRMERDLLAMRRRYGNLSRFWEIIAELKNASAA